jgi:tetratricopeptide (TPR) repeat protein
MNSKYLDFEELLPRALQSLSPEEEEVKFLKNHYETLQLKQPCQENILSLSACHFFLSEFQESLKVLNSFPFPHSSHLLPFKHLLTALNLQKQENFDLAFEHLCLSETTFQSNLDLQRQVQEKALDFCISRKNWSKATENFEKLKNFQMISSKVYTKIAFCFENQEKTSEAIFFYELAGKCEGFLAILSEFWAEVLRNETVSEKFLSLSKDLQSGSRLLSDLSFLKAQWLLRKGLYEEAEDILKEISENIQNDYYWLSLGYLHLKKNNIHKAYTCTLKSLKINQSLPESWFNLAIVYHRVRQTEAQSALTRAQKLGLCSEDLSEPLLAQVQIWSLGEVSVLKSKKVLQLKKKPEIIIPTAVKTSSFPLTPNMFICYKMFNDYLLKKSQESEKIKNSDELELADILTHLNLPSKRSRH